MEENKPSKFGKINLLDIGKGVLLVSLTASLQYLLDNVMSIHFVDNVFANQGIIFNVSLICAYLLKQLGSDSKGVPLGGADKK